jgi:hypothetical protein
MVSKANTSCDNTKLGAKFEESTAEQFREFCDARGQNLSSVIRRLVLEELASHSYLSEDKKKALGVDSSE